MNVSRNWVPVFALVLSLHMASGGQLPEPEASVHGFPVLRDLSGRKLAAGDFTQWIEREGLHVRIQYDFGGGHQVQEDAVFRQTPILVQEEWFWMEVQQGKTLRTFTVDFKTGTARAEVSTAKQPKRWTEHVKAVPGETFAGFGFTLAIKSVRERLLRGEKVEFKAIGFTPKPRVVGVEISYAGLNQVPMSGRRPLGECFLIHAKVPALAKVFVSVPDTHIWLTHPPPAEFLRWEGPFVEPSDPVVRVDLLAGDPSGPAEPVAPVHK